MKVAAARCPKRKDFVATLADTQELVRGYPRRRHVALRVHGRRRIAGGPAAAIAPAVTCAHA